MDLEQIINEVYDTANKSYPAYSTPARKDFVPQSTRNTASYPYQNGLPQDDITNPPPESVPSIPWPLQTAVDDFADSFAFLTTGASKIASCVKNNPSISSKQRDDLIVLFKKCKKALELIRDVGYVFVNASNLAGPQPSQNPVQSPETKLPESDPVRATIKIKVK